MAVDPDDEEPDQDAEEAGRDVPVLPETDRGAVQWVDPDDAELAADDFALPEVVNIVDVGLAAGRDEPLLLAEALEDGQVGVAQVRTLEAFPAVVVPAAWIAWEITPLLEVVRVSFAPAEWFLSPRENAFPVSLGRAPLFREPT